MPCPKCGCEYTRIALSASGKTYFCRDCDSPVSEDAAPIVVAPPTPARAVAKAPAPTTKLGAAGTIRAAKAEARALRVTIREHERALKKARTELAKLDRLLDAAEARPRAVVRPIRTTA